MDVKVISLKRTIQRREEFSKQNARLSYNFFDAVDGAELTLQDLMHSNKVAPNLPYTAGAYGCALSHLALWESAINTNSIVTIAEDDAIFRDDFSERATELLEKLPFGWDIVLWGWNFDSILALNVMSEVSPCVVLCIQEQLRISIPQFTTQKTRPTLLPLDKCFGLPAYSISPSGAKKYKALCFPLQNFTVHMPIINQNMANTGIDVALSNIYASTSAHICLPPLVATKNLREVSTIQNNLKIK
jgi:glycosyl transferase family 25